MKEAMKINSYLLLLMLSGGYLLCCCLALIEKIFMMIPTPILIVGFCYLIYKTILNEVERGN